MTKIVRAAALALLTLALPACSDDLLGPELHAPVPCTLNGPFAGQAMAFVTTPGLLAALADAESRLLMSLADSADLVPLRETMNALIREVERPTSNASCRSLQLARSLLAQQAEDPQTRPARAALALVLDITESALAAQR